METDNAPQDVEAERIVLGSLLNGLEQGQISYLHDVQGILVPSDFTIARHRTIFTRIMDLAGRGENYGTYFVVLEMEKHSELEHDTLSYLSDLWTGLPLYPNIKDYVRLLKNATAKRKAMEIGHMLVNHAQLTGASAHEILESAKAKLAEVSSPVQSEGLVNGRDIIEAVGVTALLEAQKHRGIHLPWNRLDETLSGVGPGQLLVLMAATSKGKTSMALQIATAALSQGVRTAIWTMEMTPKSLISRMITQQSGVFAGKQLATADERQAQRDAIDQILEHSPYFDQCNNVTQFITNIRTAGPMGLAIVDHLQLIRCTGDRGSRAQETGDHARELKEAAMELNMAVLALSQVDRASVKGGGKIGLHSAKESGDIENHADVIMWIDAPELERYHDTQVSLHIGKQREGPAGFSIPMVFRPSSQTFIEGSATE